MKHLLLLLIFVPCLAAAQVTLQPWTQVYGTVPGQSLGRYVTGNIQSSNFPYKAAVSKFGNTGVYRLQTQSDTTVRQQFFGENLLTGDLNNDGHADVVLTKSVNGWDTVFVYWGSATGVDTLNPLAIPGENQDDAFGARCIGDANNDGKEDLVATAPNYPNRNLNGKVYFFLNPVRFPIPSRTIVGDSARLQLGTSTVLGDLNGDGFNDIIVRGRNQRLPVAKRYNYLNIYWGKGIDTLNLSVGVQLTGMDINNQGLACFDANGDAMDELLWTNRDAQGDWVYVHYGGLSFDTLPSLRLQNPGVANFGNSIISVGDMSGDGNTEIAVAASLATNTSGFVFIFEGGRRLDAQFDAAVGMGSNSNFGYSISPVGDIDGDRLSDIIVGAPAYAFGESRGYWGVFKGDSTITGLPQETGMPSGFRVYPAFPNPFNPLSTIQFDVGKGANIVLEVFDLLGQRVATLVNEKKSPGTYQTIFDGSPLSSGVYVYRLTAKTADGRTWSDTKKVTLLK